MNLQKLDEWTVFLLEITGNLNSAYKKTGWRNWMMKQDTETIEIHLNSLFFSHPTAHHGRQEQTWSSSQGQASTAKELKLDEFTETGWMDSVSSRNHRKLEFSLQEDWMKKLDDETGHRNNRNSFEFTVLQSSNCSSWQTGTNLKQQPRPSSMVSQCQHAIKYIIQYSSIVVLLQADFIVPLATHHVCLLPWILEKPSEENTCEERTLHILMVGRSQKWDAYLDSPMGIL